MLKDFTDVPILVTGAARSGTSMVAACIHLCGAWKGNTAGPSKWNAKGMFENLELRQNVVKPILKQMKMDPRGQYPMPDTKDVRIPLDFKERVVNIISGQGWRNNLPWVYKCVKLSLIWPIWFHAFPRSKCIVVRRKTQDIVYSCMRTAFMREFAFSDTLKKIGKSTEEEGWEWWVEFYKNKFNEMINNGVNIKVIWPEKMVYGDYSEMKDVIEWLGLKWNGPAIVDFIEPKLWKSDQARKGR